MIAKRSGARSKGDQRISVSLQPVQQASSEPPLSRERIVATAVELLDAQGIDGLTMRRLADRLGSGVMSLYWHVDNKEDVFDLAVDSVLEHRGSPETGESPDWRGDVVHMLEDWRARMLRHPWSASLLPRRALGRNILGRLEMLSKTLSRAGVADADLNAAIWSLWNYVMGATLTRASFDLSEEDRAAAQQRLTHLSEHYPTIERSRLLLDNDWDGAFRRGLDFLLDGLSPR
ncbi:MULTISPECIES: TetR/AcrR family transcriptional regulator C-terminal domain-containing protein [unclassified Mesorhizobium]|uniref:TetR/AcrR family transcriptional regulator C-terminal domain-containing protein n=1 Tax=unclassified Mesorhizobium TaxID=325217 RepID=UPI0004874103|nr:MULTISPECIES: TetR/AcrR family transcriptional regulator C-terminal domain-containing protein [unclassified Mesorhizobium]RUZ85288.1 TetR family transcriptional regulator [Mesorhizobium sp. M7A.F.Ca.US.003.02.2.1]RUX77196.1 TetR family transcriptional regulator [Mesorhizobium sp. M7A.F.Ca.US.005.03.1.1]RUY07103.1 TetR family transcriptional regulator [Mesorhizobium sp. M7A.F.Ca.US.005.03.2.1]RUY22733.1 TetR family transcriptional regulator [Mesorhizobium sp. M7A.F.Ca.US.001.04.2.1]RUY35024.